MGRLTAPYIFLLVIASFIILAVMGIAILYIEDNVEYRELSNIH